VENDTKSLMNNTFSPLDKGLKGGGGAIRIVRAVKGTCTVVFATEGPMQSYWKKRRYHSLNEF
jgi:hypothetical protein